MDRFRKLKFIGWITLVASGLSPWLLPAQEATGGASSLAELQSRVSAHISQQKFSAALWGIKVASLESGKTLFEHNAEKLFSPASNSKLYTVALALDRLGADYRIRTSLYATAKQNRRGTLNHDLKIH